MLDKEVSISRGASWAMLDNLAQQAVSFLIFVVLARLIAPQDFGLMAVAHLIVTLVRQTVFDAISHPVARAHNPTDHFYSRAFTVCLLLSVVTASVMVLAAQPLAVFYQQPQLEQILRWMSVVIVACGSSAILEARMVRQMQFKLLAIRSIVSAVVGGMVGVALAQRGAGVMALVTQQIVTSVLGLLLLASQVRWRPTLVWRGLGMRAFVPDAYQVSVTGLFNFMATQGDTLLVSIFLGSYATGIYSFAKRLTSAVYLVVGGSLLRLAMPAFASAGNDPAALRSAYLRILGLSFFLMTPMLVGMGGLAHPLIEHFFGPAWVSAAPIVALLALLYLIFAANQINDYLLFAVGERNIPARRGLLQIVLALLMGWAVSSQGLFWTSAAFVCSGALVWPWAQGLANRHLQWGPSAIVSALQGPVIASLVMLAFLLLTPQFGPQSMLSLIGYALTGAALYLLTHALVTRVSPHAHNALHGLFSLQKAPP